LLKALKNNKLFYLEGYMSDSNDINTRWQKISKKSIERYMFVDASLLRHCPLMLALIVMLELFNGYRNQNLQLFLYSAIIKLLLSYFTGVYAGYLEWNFLEKMVDKTFKSTKDIGKSYIYIYGIWMFGSNMTIALVEPAFEGLTAVIVKLVIYPLAGLVWGAFMSAVFSGNYNKYISS
jgi:hypothetical protein